MSMNQSVVKTLKLLDLFTEECPELSLKEIAEASKIPKPTAYRLLAALEHTGFLIKSKESAHDTSYRLGLKLLELGNLVSEQMEVRSIAKPHMKELAHDLNEIVHLVIVNQEEAVYIEKVESTRSLRLYTKIGKSSPLHLGSGPKLLLAFLPEEKQQRVIEQMELYDLNQQTPVDKDKLREELRRIRTKGCSISIGEQDIDTTGVSYPIRDYSAQVVAALAVSGLSSRFEGDHLTSIKDKTEAAAKRISAEMGYQGG